MENNTQKVKINEDGEIIVETGLATISSKNENQPVARLQGTYEMEAEDVAKLIAMTKNVTFLSFFNNFCMLTSETEVKEQLSQLKEMVDEDMEKRVQAAEETMEAHEEYKKECEKLKASYEERLQAAIKLNDTNDKACKLAEKHLLEEQERYDKLVLQIKAFNEMPWIRRIFRNIVL